MKHRPDLIEWLILAFLIVLAVVGVGVGAYAVMILREALR